MRSARARTGRGWKDPKLQFRILPLEVELGQVEYEGEEQKRRGVEKQVIAVYQHAKGGWLLVGNQAQQWIVGISRIERVQNDATGYRSESVV